MSMTITSVTPNSITRPSSPFARHVIIDGKRVEYWAADEAGLTQPLKWRKPRMVFVCAHGDLFAEGVHDEWIDRVFAVMALCPQHTFQVLTKRARRMQEYLSRNDVSLLNRWARAFEPGSFCLSQHQIEAHLSPFASPEHRALYRADQIHAPLPNVWLGISAEDQTRANERLKYLIATPAAVRWVSAEPLLGPVDLTHWFHAPLDMARRLDWVVVGGESGPGARVWPGFEGAARSLRDQCQLAGVPFFMKQMQGERKAAMPPIPDDLMIREFPQFPQRGRT